MHQHSVATALTMLLATAPSAMAGLYSKKSPVLQVDSKSFNRLINQSNYTSIVEFYAPWCGHCKNLQPAYEKAAKNLEGLAKVAAIDCDQESNKQFCSSMGVQGFPTLKIVRPGKKPGKPVVEDYNGGRTASAISEAVTSKINNHVTRATDKDLDQFLSKGDGPKALLFTDKGTTSALLRSIAIDYLGVISVAQIRNKETKAVKQYGIEKFPTLVLVPGNGEKHIVHHGDMTKAAMLEFLRKAGEPNPDPAPAKGKADKKKSKKDDKAKAKKPSKEAEPEEAAEEAETTTEETARARPTPRPIAIMTATSKYDIAGKCLEPKSHTCFLALVPADETEDSKKVVDSLTQINTRFVQSGLKVFPLVAVPDSVTELAAIREKLGVAGAVELVAINARRNWWRQYEGDFGVASVEAWIDAVRMGEGAKKKLPDGIADEPVMEAEEEPKVEEEEPKVEDDPTTEDEAAEEHDEL